MFRYEACAGASNFTADNWYNIWPDLQSTSSVWSAEPNDASGAANPPAAVNVAKVATYFLTNRGATMGAGEPIESAAMTRSVWVRFAPTRNTRVALHTFGSFGSTAELDTVLAVYRQGPGTGWGSLVRVAGNNNVTVPGVSTKQSLIQFDATAGSEYFVQVGTVGNAEGDIALNVMVFDPGGGLSAFPHQVGPAMGAFPIANGLDYVCIKPICPTVVLVAHNSSAQPLSVTGSTTFPTHAGSLFDNPAPISLPPGGLATMTFTGRSVSNSDARTETGRFVLTGRTVGIETTRATYDGIVGNCCGNPHLTTSFVSAVLPNARSGAVNRLATGFASIANVGANTAVGCVISTSSYGVKVRFQATDPQTNQPVGLPNTPVDIPVGQTRTLMFSIAKQYSATGEPDTTLNKPLLFIRANANRVTPNSVVNNFALTSLGTLRLPDMIALAATPSADGIVNVPPTSQAFAVASFNVGFAGEVRARPQYIRPASETEANKQFTAFICRTNPTTGACLQPPAAHVDFLASANQSYTFATFVQRPSVDPGFDPAQRRMVVRFDYLTPDGWEAPGVRLPVSVGSTSVAVRTTN